VTGGAGFIGSHVTSALLARGHQVLVIDDLSGGFRDNVPAAASFQEMSVTDHDRVAALFRDFRPRFVYHLAAYAAEGLSHFIRRFNYTNNLIGSVNLINESIRQQVECFVFTSSIAVYGAAKPPVREDALPVPEDPYGIAKLAVEQDLRACHEMFGLDSIVFRPHNVYGEFQNIGDRYRNVVGIFMNQIMQGKPLTVFGDGAQTRAFSYIGDMAPTIAAAVDVPAARNQVFNIGADRHHSINELAQAVMKAMNAESPIRHLPARLETVHAFADHSKVDSVFGVQARTSLEAGLSRMAAWARAAGVRKTPRFENIEVSHKLPAVWLED
jgi:UDP-glucose 4-epimerase